jgi:ectoine hydroxylase-related dioxygenase (phytanoyl-CoA dioxygenase family)
MENDNLWSDLNRELRFYPSQCDNPRRLSQEQIEFYDQNGYLTGFRILNDEEATANRQYLDRLLANLESGKDSYSINGYHKHCRGIYNLVVNPTILEYVHDLLGPNFVCWGTHYFCKMPGDGKTVSWHQDAHYWPLTPSKTVTVWLAIDDADIENACMQFISGSHRRGELNHRASHPAEDNVLYRTAETTEICTEPVHIELKAGEISLHSDLLLHGSPRNNSHRRRCGLTMRYASTDVIAHEGWNQNSILCCGVDVDGNWADIQRPEAEG